MPLPVEYQRASDQFYACLTDLRDHCGFGSCHQAYTMLQAVFQVFRVRLAIAEAIRFAGVLPPVLRALFIADWDLDQSIKPFDDLEAMNKEVKLLRPEHNFSTDTAIEDVASVLKKHVNLKSFETVLTDLPQAARRFWYAEHQ